MRTAAENRSRLPASADGDSRLATFVANVKRRSACLEGTDG